MSFDFGFDGNTQGFRTDVRGDVSYTMFESMHAQLEYIKRHTPGELRSEVDEAFAGRSIKNLSELEAATFDFWGEGVTTVDEMMRQLRELPIPAPKDRRRKGQWNDEGEGELDLERLQQGDLAYREAKRESTEGPATITVVADMTAPAIKKSSSILWRGAAALVLTHLLESKGYRVELIAATINEKAYRNQPSKTLVTSVCLKKHSDPLDMTGMVNAVSGWYYRTAYFQTWHATAARNNATMAEGLGFAGLLTPARVEVIVGHSDAVIVSHVFDLHAAMGLIVDVVHRLAAKE